MVFNISSKANVLFGVGASEQTGAKVKQFGWKKVICIFDKGIREAGIADKVIGNIKAAGVEVVEFAGVLPDPPDYVVEEAAEIARKAEVDGVVGIGGGSSMDTAKGVNILLTNPSPISLHYGFPSPARPGKGLVLVPTTSGTGSEISIAAVITDTKNKTKAAIAGPICVPQLAIIDPSFTLSLPPLTTAQNGIDTYSHAVESYTSKMSNPFTDFLNEKVMQLVVANLPVAVKNPSDIKAREALSFAGMLAAMALNDAMIHLGHAIAHVVGALTHTVHGTCCALTTPIIVEYLADVLPDKVRRIGEILGLELKSDLPAGELGREVAAGIRAFEKGVGLPVTFSEANIPEATLAQVAQLVKEGSPQSPKAVNPELTLELLKKAYA